MKCREGRADFFYYLLSKFVWYHGDEWDREEASLSGMGQEVALHPILVFRFLIDNDDDVILFESQLVLVVSRTVVQGSATTPTRRMLLKKTKESYSVLEIYQALLW